MSTWKDVERWLTLRNISPGHVKNNELPQTWRKGADAVYTKLVSLEDESPRDIIRFVTRSVGRAREGLDSNGELVAGPPAGDTEVVDRLYKSLKLIIGTTEAKKILDAARGGK